MSRFANLIACLTVLTTALPQGWCCYVPFDSANCESIVSHGAVSHHLAVGSGCCPLCGIPNAADETQEIGSDSSSPVPPLNAPLRECCRRAPMSRPGGTDILDNLMFAFGVPNQQIIGVEQPDILLGSAQAVEPLHSSLRLHASLGRWLC